MWRCTGRRPHNPRATRRNSPEREKRRTSYSRTSCPYMDFRHRILRWRRSIRESSIPASSPEARHILARAGGRAIIHSIAAIRDRVVGADSKQCVTNIVCTRVTIETIVIGRAASGERGENTLLLYARCHRAGVLIFAIEDIFTIRWVDRILTGGIEAQVQCRRISIIAIGRQRAAFLIRGEEWVHSNVFGLQISCVHGFWSLQFK